MSAIERMTRRDREIGIVVVLSVAALCPLPVWGQGLRVQSPIAGNFGGITNVGKIGSTPTRYLDARTAGLGVPGPIIQRCHDAGVRDLFPKLDPKTDEGIASGPKIPVHREWSSQINDGELAIDSALNLAALATFSKDQAALDERIRGLI